MVEYNCGYACGFTEPYGFVPEGGCPIHDTAEFSAIINTAIAREQERCANIAFDVGYSLADEAEDKFYDGWTASDLVVDASEKVAAAIRATAPAQETEEEKHVRATTSILIK